MTATHFLDTIARVGRDGATVVRRQFLFTAVYTVAQAMLVVPGVAVTSARLVVAAGLVVGLATLLAVAMPWGALASWWGVCLPLLDLVAIGLLRAGTGGELSIFAVMFILPIAALAFAQGRIPVLIGVAVVAGFYLGPLVLDPPVRSSSLLIRGVFVPAVFGLLGLIVHELAGRLRSRSEVLEASRLEQARLLTQARRATAANAALNSLLHEAATRVAVLDAATEQAIIGTDLAGRIQVFNTGAEKLLGMDAATVIGSADVIDLHSAVQVQERADGGRGRPGQSHPADGRDALMQHLVAKARAGYPDTQDWSYRRADDTTVEVQVTVTSRRDVEGVIDGFLFVGVDVTTARDHDRLQVQFVNLISHELRTPLSSLMGYLELIGDDETGPLSPEKAAFLVIVDRNAQRLLQLVSDLLFTAQVGSGQFRIQHRDVDVASLVMTAVESARQTAATRGIDLNVDVGPGHGLLLGDPDRLGQAIDNLLSNALKYTPPTGRVDVTVALDRQDPAAPRTLIAVRDTGVGIPSVELDRLFTSFFRASTAEGVDGVGLGLTITKAIAEAHGGVVHVDSVVGSGTTFTLDLPGVPRSPTPGSGQSDAFPSGPDHRPYSVPRLLSPN